jgi:NmrA-like family
MTSDRTILITGITGHQGGAVAQALQNNGFRLRGLTRKPESEKAAALARHGVDVVKGDLAARSRSSPTGHVGRLEESSHESGQTAGIRWVVGLPPSPRQGRNPKGCLRSPDSAQESGIPAPTRRTSVVDRQNTCTPRAESPSSKLRPLSFDIRRPPVAQLDRHLYELNILEMPAPPRIDADAWDNSPIGDARRPAALSGAC